MFGDIPKQKKIIESTYTDTCDIYNFEKVLNGSITTNKKVIAYENIKCALSQQSQKPTEQTESQNKVEYIAKLFIAPDIRIKAGSQIDVNHLGYKISFEQTGEPFIYVTHQEILLKRNTRA